MPIEAEDILFKLSTTEGSAGNSEAGAPGESLGKYISVTEILSGELHELFPPITGAENAASQVDYQCLFVHNAHETLTLVGASIYISSQVTGGATVNIGVDPTAASAVGSSEEQALEIANRTTAPVGVTFSNPTSVGAALSLGDLGAGECRAVWIRRTASNSGPVANDGATLVVFGDTL